MIRIAICDDEKHMSDHIRAFVSDFFRRKNREISIQASVLYAITDFQFLNLAGLSVWMPYAMIGACMIEIPLFAFLAVRSYCRHALN